MKKTLFAIAFVVASIPAFAADTATAAAPAKAPSGQQQRMTGCNADAKTKALKGADRKSFMSSCLKGEAAAAPAAAPATAPASGKVTQQQKMTNCNAEAKTKALKGPERKSFMSTCLKG